MKAEDGVLSIQINGRWRKIGDLSGDRLIIQRDSIEHFSKKFDGYGFNYEIIMDDRMPKFIQVEETDHNNLSIYLIPREDVLKYGMTERENFITQVYLSQELLKKLNRLN